MIRRATNIIMLHEAAHLHGKFHLIISNVIQYELKNHKTPNCEPNYRMDEQLKLV